MYPCQRHPKSPSTSSRISRRTLLGGLAAGTLAGCSRRSRSVDPRWPSHEIGTNSPMPQAPILGSADSLGMPGPYPGRVIEVQHPGSVTDGERDQTAIKMMIQRGMQQLVPEAETAIDAWRHFFGLGDRVGIKVVPVGMVHKPGADKSVNGPLVDLRRPGSISSYEVVAEVVESLAQAGIRRNDILIFERYRNAFIQAGYTTMLPEGVHWECSSTKVDSLQLEIDGQTRGEPRQSHIAGYDRDVYRELAFCDSEEFHHPDDDRRFRSHLSKIVTQKVDKIISIPVLKDHQSAGVTLALKNMSHGLVNNVARSHPFGLPGSEQAATTTLNHCHTFIPAMVSLPQTRQKCVLQILDGLVGTYEGGPGAWHSTFTTWDYKSLFFATDPVALDHIGWQIIDAKRAEEGWPAVARMGRDAIEGFGDDSSEVFPIRHPQHIPLAGMLGLGVFDRQKIDHQRVTLA
jgi:hypothetical protein